MANNNSQLSHKLLFGLFEDLEMSLSNKKLSVCVDDDVIGNVIFRRSSFCQ